MKRIIFAVWLGFALARTTFAQTPGVINSGYPTKMENLLHQTGVVITSTSRSVGHVEGKEYLAETNNLYLRVGAEMVGNADNKTKIYGLVLQISFSSESRSRNIYVDYDELDGLLAGLNKVLVLQPELPVVQAKYQTKGGLIVGAYSTERRDVLGLIEFDGVDGSRIKLSLDKLRDFRDLVTAGKASLDLLRTTN
jgi:hypothetical protein